jgi:hypothetical protein
MLAASTMAGEAVGPIMAAAREKTRPCPQPTSGCIRTRSGEFRYARAPSKGRYHLSLRNQPSRSGIAVMRIRWLIALVCGLFSITAERKFYK